MILLWPRSRANPIIAGMAPDHPFTIEIEFHIEKRMRRYRWGIYESGELRDRARESFVTKREAQADAAKVMEEHITTWRGKRSR